MSELTLSEMIEIMRECAGEEASVDVGDDIGDVDLQLLGYDSLALMEAAAIVKRTYRVELSDDALSEVRTLNQFVAAVQQVGRS
ncbi:phosphopantetheine-binding protein [Micromonospora sp. NPDC048871]|uniref:phosphopantetheine-binding protein n=1 Tax=unclassified Micromonospora TaxID=2617518 RepID=UPI002E15C9DE|nr:phosphopantetheine-binding protein [Micromonospora sp. NBC_01739]